MEYCLFWAGVFICNIKITKENGKKVYNCISDFEGIEKAIIEGMPRYFAEILKTQMVPSFLVERIKNDPDLSKSKGRCMTDKFILKINESY